MPMSTLLDQKKHFAAAVLIAFLATLVSGLGIQVAGQHAVEKQETACKAGDLDMSSFEQGKAPVSAGEPSKALCELEGLKAQLHADDVFLFTYSALNFSFFLFLAAILQFPPSILRFRTAVRWAVTGAGLVLAVVMLCADFRENQLFLHWICQARHALSTDLSGALPPGPAIEATRLKWSALAAASALLGLIYLVNPSRVAKLVALPAFGTAAVLVASLAVQSPPALLKGRLAALGVLWLAILIHAVIVAIESPPPGVPQAAGQGENHV
jgi:hypothetical protein